MQITQEESSRVARNLHNFLAEICVNTKKLVSSLLWNRVMQLFISTFVWHIAAVRFCWKRVR